MIDSTTDFEQVREVLWDVVVIGGGPAGAMAAIRLSRDGRKVLLVEKSTPPRDKICGCCLNATAVKMLEQIGFKPKMLVLNAVPIASLSLRARAGRAELPLVGGLAISRATLDSQLILHAINDGSQFLSGTKALVDEVSADSSRSVILERDELKCRVQTRCVIVADGLNGHSLDKWQSLAPKTVENSRIGAGVRVTDFPRNLFDEGVIYMTCGAGGYVGMVILEDGSLDIAAAFDKDFVRSHRSVGAAANEVIRGSALSAFDLSSLDWHGTPPLTRRRKQFSAPSLFVIGDAASYAEPFTGEGMEWAFRSANEVVPLVGQLLRSNLCSLSHSRLHSHSDSGRFDHAEWDRRHSKLLALRQYRSMALAHFLRHPRCVEFALRLLSNFPNLAKPLLNSVSGKSRDEPSVRDCRNEERLPATASSKRWS